MNTEQFDRLIDSLTDMSNNIYQPETKTNSWNISNGDELHDIAFSLTRIADALEIIAKK
jgi:hypothetical protein